MAATERAGNTPVWKSDTYLFRDIVWQVRQAIANLGNLFKKSFAVEWKMHTFLQVSHQRLFTFVPFNVFQCGGMVHCGYFKCLFLFVL